MLVTASPDLQRLIFRTPENTAFLSAPADGFAINQSHGSLREAVC